MFNMKNVIYCFMASVLVLLPIFFIIDYASDYMDNALNEDEDGYETQVD